MERLVLQPSRILFLSVLTLFILAAACVWWLDLSLWVKLILSCALVVYFMWTNWRAICLQGKKTVQSVQWNDTVWRLSFAKGEEIDATLLPSSIVTRYLILLYLKSSQGKRFNVLLLADSASSDQLKRLRRRVLVEYLQR